MEAEWEKCEISELCARICSGGTPKSMIPSYYGGTIPWLNTKEINFNRIYNTENTITEEGLRNSSAKWVNPDSVIVAMYGATAGRCAIAKIPLTTNQACCNLEIQKEKADYRFVYYALCRDFVRLSSLANGGAQQNLNIQRIKEFDIPLPPLPIQQKIASILSSLDDKIELNNRIIRNLEAQAEALYAELFIKNASASWKKGTLSELLVVKYGKDHKKLGQGKVPVYGSGGIMRYADGILYDKESVLIPRKGTLNNVIYINEPFWCVDTMFYTEMKYPHLAKFIYHFLKRKNLESLNAGSAVPSMTTEILNRMELSIPSSDCLEYYDGRITPIYCSIALKNKENKRLAAIRDALLPKLMNGKLNVEDQFNRFINAL